MISLNDAIDALYATFAAVPKPNTVDGCACCWDLVKARKLLEVPVRTISNDVLSDYGASVFLTAGDETDFRYFLPRLLEIGAKEPDWWPSPEVLLEKLALAKWLSWPARETDVIKQFLDAWFGEALRVEAFDGRYGLSWREGDQLLCGLARAGLDLEPYLRRLLLPAHHAQLRGLYWVNFSGKKGRIKLSNSFWYEKPEHRGCPREAPLGVPLIAFLERPEVQAVAMA